MNVKVYALAVLFVVSGCAAPSWQNLAEEQGNYSVKWCEGKVCQINYTGPKFPNDVLKVVIDRSEGAKEVNISTKHRALWSKDIFKPTSDIGSRSGVVFHSESHYEQSDRFETQEWKIEKTGELIYKEVTVQNDAGEFKKLEFYGPFGLLLKSRK